MGNIKPQDVYNDIISKDDENPYITIKIGAIIDVRCYNNGVSIIKQVLNLGKDYHPDITINLQSSPTYLITLIINDFDEGSRIIYKVIDIIKKEMILNDGQCQIVQEPQVIENIMIKKIKFINMSS